MADASSNGSSSSGYSESRRRSHHRTNAELNPSSTNSEACSTYNKLPSDRQSWGRAVESYKDRVIAKKAVEIVINATRNRPGVKGAVSLCTEVTRLLQTNQSLEQIICLQRNELLSYKAKLKKNASLPHGSNKSVRRENETKGTQIKPILVNRSTSPLLKEVYVKSSSEQTAQTEISSFDAKWRLGNNGSDNGCPAVEGRDEIKIHNNMTKASENCLKLQEENVQLKNELSTLKNEIESLKKKEETVFPMISEGQPTISTTMVASLAQQLDQQSKGKAICVCPSQRQEEHLNPENELPHIPQARTHGQALDNKPRVCYRHQRQWKKGFSSFSSPCKVSPSQRQPIRPTEMYSPCKCLRCTLAVLEEKEVWCGRHTTDRNRKSPKRSEILPCIGDHVVIRSDLTGVVKYVGPVRGEKQSYVGLHLDAPVGNNNGSVDGVHYFSCPSSYGALVPVDEVLCVTSSNIVKDKNITVAPTVCHKSSSSATFQIPKTVKELYKEKSN